MKSPLAELNMRYFNSANGYILFVIIGLLIKFCLNIIYILILLLSLPKIIKLDIEFLINLRKMYGLYIDSFD